MTVRRGLAWFFAFIGVLIIGCALYLAFVDLGRHKGQIEKLVSDLTGREFVIQGDLHFELFPSVSLVTEDVRFANADWASKQPMVQAGRLSANVGLRSLLSGPIEIHAFELRDAKLLLERGRDEQVNWNFRKATSAGSVASDDVELKPAATPIPLVIEKATLRNVEVIYRTRGKRDRVVRFDQLTIAPAKPVAGAAPLLALEGRGQLNEYAITVDGEAGPLDSLLKGRDLRMDLKATVGRLGLDIKGSIGRLVPLDGTDLKINARGSEVDAMLARLELPLFATGELRLDATIADLGELTRIDWNATAGDLASKGTGTLSGLQLRGADLKFEASAADAARLANVFGIQGVPAAPLVLSGRIKPLNQEIRFEALRAQVAGASARLDGKWRRGRDRGTQMKFELGVEDLSVLRADLPQGKFSASGSFTADKATLAIADLAAALDETRLAGSLSVTRGEPRRIEADLSSPRIDLTPYFPSQPTPATPAAPAAPAKEMSAAKQKGVKTKKKFMFSDEPLPILKLSGTEARIKVAVAELVLGNKSLRDIEGSAEIDGAHVTVTARAHGSLEGTMDGAITFEPIGEDSAKFILKAGLENVRAGLDMKEMQPNEVPPLNLEVDLATTGNSARQMASNANGHIVLLQGAGKTKTQFLDAFGGNVLAELRSRLNPFKANDPFTNLECTVARADIIDGAVTLKPMLLQTQKVTVVAQGKVDLHTEQLTLEFDTRPRKGIGVSPGMFTNPFIRVEGTLQQPRLAMGAKGVTSGAVAAATGGLSVIASGLVDRLKGEGDMCSKTIEAATHPKANR